MPVKKKGLGSNTGLGSRLKALGLKEKHINEADKASREGYETVAEADIRQIVPNPQQARQDFSPEALAELAASIRQFGLIQPLVVQKKKDGTYELVAGERRLRAARQAGLTKVPVIIKAYEPALSAEVSLIENLQRQNLNIVEEAEAYHMLISQFGLTQEEVARKIGRSRPYIANTLRLLRLPDQIRQWLREGTLTMGQARPLLQLPDAAMQIKAAERIIKLGLSARQCETLAASLLSDTPARRKDEPDAYLEAVQDRMKMHLGTNVSIRFNQSRHKGKIEISVSSEAELERLLALLTDEEPPKESDSVSSFTV